MNETNILKALKVYRICAYITGIFLLLLCLEMLLKYGFDLELYLGGNALNGVELMQVDTGTGLNVNATILIIHGWLYVLYLFVSFRLWEKCNWDILQLVVLALGGIIPGFSFYLEYKIPLKVSERLA